MTNSTGRAASAAKVTAGPVPRRAKAAAASVPAEASRASSKPAFQRFARLGLFARAAIYVLLASLAGDIALTHRSPAQPTGAGALTEVGRQPGGRALLSVLAIGLAGYALWRTAQALGLRGQGQGMTGVFKRAGWASVAIIYFSLCARAVTLAVGSPGSARSGHGGPSSNPQPFVGLVLRWPGGTVWVGLVGAGVAVGGAALVIWGLAHDYSRTLRTERMSRAAFQCARAAGIIGEVTRGLLVMLVSAYLLAAAVTDNPAHAKSLGQALRSFDRMPAGPALLLIAAAGLVCFAAFSVFEALYRDL